MNDARKESLLVSEQEVAKLLGVHVKTLQQRDRCGYPEGEIDLKKIVKKACGKRFWIRAELMKALGV